ncbi:MAG TPA: hypothetical protein PLB38_02385 [bacterium]|nr:hypothetical protein [bacterium]
MFENGEDDFLKPPENTDNNTFPGALRQAIATLQSDSNLKEAQLSAPRDDLFIARADDYTKRMGEVHTDFLNSDGVLYVVFRKRTEHYLP